MTLCGSSISPLAATSCAAVYESSSGSRKIKPMCKTTDPESARPANRNGATGVPRKSLTGARRTGKSTRWQIAFSELHHPDLVRRPETGNCGIRASERARSVNIDGVWHAKGRAGLQPIHRSLWRNPSRFQCVFELGKLDGLKEWPDRR